MSKGFDHSQLNHQKSVVSRQSFGTRRSFEIRKRPMTNN